MKRRSFALIAVLLSLGACVRAQSFVSSSAGGRVLPSVRTKPETIDEITPDALARLAAQRRQREQRGRATGIGVAVPTTALEPPQISQLPTVPEEISRDITAPNELLAQLNPVVMVWPAEAAIEAPSPQPSAYLSREQYQAFLMDGHPTRFPYSPADKFHLFIKDTYDPFALLGEGFTAFYNQAQGNPYQFGGGARGYSRRFGALVGTDFAGELFGTFLFPSILHTDPRYFRKVDGSFGGRAVYALTRTLITKKDSGGNTVNISNFLASICASAISNTYYPGRKRGVWPTVERSTINIGFDSLTGLYREFWPEMAHALHIPAFVIRRTADPMFPAQNASATSAVPTSQN